MRVSPIRWHQEIVDLRVQVGASGLERKNTAERTSLVAAAAGSIAAYPINAALARGLPVAG
jgi:hypothetical protein